MQLYCEWQGSFYYIITTGQGGDELTYETLKKYLIEIYNYSDEGAKALIDRNSSASGRKTLEDIVELKKQLK